MSSWCRRGERTEVVRREEKRRKILIRRQASRYDGVSARAGAAAIRDRSKQRTMENRANENKDGSSSKREREWSEKSACCAHCGQPQIKQNTVRGGGPDATVAKGAAEVWAG